MTSRMPARMLLLGLVALIAVQVASRRFVHAEAPAGGATEFVAHEIGTGLRGLHEVVPGEHDLRAGVLEVVADLASLEQHVHRDHDATGAQDAVVGDREVRDVGQHDPDAVAGLQALGLQHARDAGRSLVEQPVVEDGVVELDGLPFRELRGRLGQDRGEVAAHPRQPTPSRTRARSPGLAATRQARSVLHLDHTRQPVPPARDVEPRLVLRPRRQEGVRVPAMPRRLRRQQGISLHR